MEINLGLLVADDSQRRKQAETLYSEALTIRRELAKDNRYSEPMQIYSW